MTKSMRQSTLETLGLGSVLDIFATRQLPVDAGDLVDQVFGPAGDRGSLVISGANGIVGAGQDDAARLPAASPSASGRRPRLPRTCRRDRPAVPGPGAARSAASGPTAIMGNIIRLTYDGKTLPARARRRCNPASCWRRSPRSSRSRRPTTRSSATRFPEIEIRSVTSGFPQSELGVGIAHPAFPHEINKVWEIVEASLRPSPSCCGRWA